MIVLAIVALLWTGVHNAPDNAPVRVEPNGHMVSAR